MKDYVKAAWTKGNLNNQIGLPRTVLEADEDTDVLILEMGMDHAGQIERLAEIARPDIAAITNIGGSHRENFDSDDGILGAKYEIAAFLSAGDALVIDAEQCADLTRMAEAGHLEKGFSLVKTAAAGSAAAGAADFVYTPVQIDASREGLSLFDIESRGGAVSFSVPVPGAYVPCSAALAAAVCMRAGVSLSEAASALRCLERTKHRLDAIRKNGILVIDDTYNASPDSAKIGLDYLKIIQAKRRFAVLADMNELGADSSALHMKVGAAAVHAGADCIYTFGVKAGKIADGAEMSTEGSGAEIFRFGPDEKDALIEALRGILREGDAVYVKGSRSMKMEEVVSALTEV
jgi:UDP-N-acetylmuramoyl-tripeptide--D-alanyl-D-alanine ligase